MEESHHRVMPDVVAIIGVRKLNTFVIMVQTGIQHPSAHLQSLTNYQADLQPVSPTPQPPPLLGYTYPDTLTRSHLLAPISHA